jgi:hypothetical protein
VVQLVLLLAFVRSLMNLMLISKTLNKIFSNQLAASFLSSAECNHSGWGYVQSGLRSNNKTDYLPVFDREQRSVACCRL